ncbi:MAG: hypothetical protein ABIF40_03845 [archaeon]
MKKIIIIILFLAILSISVNALLINPAKINIGYAPGEIEEFTLTVTNELAVESIIEITLESDYEEYFNFPSDKILVGAYESEDVDFSLTIPELNEFGDVQIALIKFYLVPFGSSGDIGATVALKIPITTNAPYPDKFLKIEIDEVVIENVGDFAELKATISNIGTEVINTVDGYFQITNDEGFNKKVEIESLNYLFPDSSESVLVSTDTTAMDLGLYNLVLYTEYDKEESSSNIANFIIAKKEIEILDLVPKKLNSQVINTITLKTFNYWIEDLDVEIEVGLYDESSLITKTNLNSFIFNAISEKDLSLSLDLNDIMPGNYTLKIKLSYDEIETVSEFEVKVEEYQGNNLIFENQDWIVVALIASSGLLLITLILLIVLLRKKR